MTKGKMVLELLIYAKSAINQLEKLEAARSAYLWLPLFIFGYLALLSLSRPYWALLGLTGPHWALLTWPH